MWGRRRMKGYRSLPNSMQLFLRLTSVCSYGVCLSCSSIVLNARCAKGRQFGNVPAAAKSFDEKRTRVHTPLENLDGIQFIRKQDGFGIDDLQVGVDSAPIAIREKMQGIP